ncbi:Hint domain-containing protein [Gluconobacter kondonii]|uniref:Hint domain-containing protein n=1 Tax=Gluconobacter kondonii TaxID=941463 RepID=UPI00209C9B71|nr:Hint domain-containing protein [Gluconobacter kondonii]MCP1237986.1 Hint domain-containing protein [Gluconobacter kondonii]
MSSTYYTYELDAQGNPILDAKGNKIVETTWVVSSPNFAGNSNVTITDASGKLIETLTGVPNNGLVSHIQTGTDAVNGSLLSVLGGQWVSVPGSSGTIDIVLSAVSAPVFTIGGTTDINFVVNAATKITVDVYGGTASFSGGLIAGALSGSTINIGYGGTYNGNTQLISLLQGTNVHFTTGGGTLVLNGGGVFLDLSGTTITGYDPTKDTIEIQNTEAPISGYTISGDAQGNTRTITLIDNQGNDAATYTVTIADGAKVPLGTYDNSVNSSSLATNPLQITYSNGNTYIGACFLSGSMIRTPDGDIAVEEINIGDEVTTFDWKSGQDIVLPVVWVGKTHVNVRHGVPDDMSGYPIRILKDAISDGVPYKDMLITAEHSLFFDGKFVPARMLVNGQSIFYDKSITSYDYYHVETEQHSVITADGMLTESYLDTGNRHTFRQEGRVVALTPSRNLTWDDAAAPLGVSREFAEPLFRKAEARAEAASIAQKEGAVELTDEANLHLVTDTGAVIRQAREHNGSVVFMLPTGVRSVRIVSNASRPSDVIGPFVDDRRYFGIAVGEITMFEAGRKHAVTAHLTEKELDGWNTLEWEDTRWTSGNALLPLGERHPNSVALLAIQVKKAGPYLASDSADIQSVKTA